MGYLQTTTRVAKGSVQDAADAAIQQGAASSMQEAVAEALMNVDMIVLIDQSGSMIERDARGGKSRFDAADEALAELQEQYPGRIALVEFSSEARFLPNGIPTRMGEGTDMLKPLAWVKALDAGDTFTIVLISDGEPQMVNGRYSIDPERETIEFAKSLGAPVHTIYIGEEGGRGEAFMRRMAAATRGRSFESEVPGELMPGVIALLGAG